MAERLDAVVGCVEDRALSVDIKNLQCLGLVPCFSEIDRCQQAVVERWCCRFQSALKILAGEVQKATVNLFFRAFRQRPMRQRNLEFIAWSRTRRQSWFGTLQDLIVAAASVVHPVKPQGSGRCGQAALLRLLWSGCDAPPPSAPGAPRSAGAPSSGHRGTGSAERVAGRWAGCAAAQRCPAAAAQERCRAVSAWTDAGWRRIGGRVPCTGLDLGPSSGGFRPRARFLGICSVSRVV